MTLTCAQAGSLMTFYINNKLKYPLKQMFEEHLENCPACYEKYKTLIKVMLQMSEAKDYIDNIEIEEKKQTSPEDEKKYVLVQSLSAYSDNELEEAESLKVKKYVITNLTARKTLEELFALKKMLKDSFDKTSNKFKEDYSKDIMKRLDLNEEYYRSGSRLKVASIFIFLLTSLTLGLFYIVSSMLI